MTIRLWTKLRLSGKMLAEDYICLVAFLAYAGGISSLMVIIINDYDMSALYKAPLKLYILTFAGDVLYCLIVPMIKVSILLQYKTIFVLRRGEFMHTVVDSLIYIVVMCYMVIVVAAAVLFGQSNCAVINPSNAVTCFVRQSKIWAASGWFNLVSDVTILLLPIRPIWRLQVPWTSKIRIAAIFGLGILACVASAFRANKCQLILYLSVTNPAAGYDLGLVRIWSSAEIAAGIVVGCLPVLPRFIKEYAPGRRTSSTTDRRREPPFFLRICFRVAKQRGFRNDSKTANSSYIEAQDPGLPSLHSNTPQTPAQTYNNISVRTSVTITSYEGRNDRGMGGRDESYIRLDDIEHDRNDRRVGGSDESYIRLDDIEHGERIRKRSSIGPGTLSS